MNSVTKNICHYSKRARTCHLLCKRPECYHSASKTHMWETGSLSDSLNSLNSLNLMKVLHHLGKTPMSSNVTSPSMEIYLYDVIFTAHKRSLRRLCFHSVIPSTREGCILGGSASWRVCIWEGCSASRGGPRVCIQGVCFLEGGLHPPIGYYGIQSKRGRYASYWNAFFLFL